MPALSTGLPGGSLGRGRRGARAGTLDTSGHDRPPRLALEVLCEHHGWWPGGTSRPVPVCLAQGQSTLGVDSRHRSRATPWLAGNSPGGPDIRAAQRAIPRILTFAGDLELRTDV